MSSTEREFNLLEDDEESGSESVFTEVDSHSSNDLTESDSVQVFLLIHLI